MARTSNKNRDEKELGFGSKNYNNTVRFINTDGAINVKRSGLSGFNNIDVYHWLIASSRAQLAAVIVLGYIFVNLVFAAIYYSIGVQNFGGVERGSATQEFMSMFFFSAQTVTTLGYGHIYPIGNAASVAAAAESLLGLLSFAIATGILFGRFSRPKADILYSKNILISPYKEGRGLMFRITNKKQYELIETEASVNLTLKNPETNRREFFSLDLELNRVNFLALSWTIVHHMNENSPIYGLSVKELEERDAEVIILIKAINDTFSQTVHSRYSYKWHDMVENAKFKALIPDAGKKGKVKISVTDIHHYDKLPVNNDSTASLKL
ncbi:MAG: ion transporter [Bacteroidia bacterium]|nr:ion transporter [Bacteroidia bacterium]